MSDVTAEAATQLFRDPPERYLDVGVGEVAYRRVGSGPDVLFVHGWPVSGATFRRLLPHLAGHVTCHLVDLLGTGSSRFTDVADLSIAQHIHAVRRVVDLLELDDVAVVGHDSGGLIARHAMVGDPRMRAMGLIDTEQPHGLSLRFQAFLLAKHAPGLGAAFGMLSGRPRLQRNPFVLGAAFNDRSLLDDEFDELFLRPMAQSPQRRSATAQLLKSFDRHQVSELADIHRRITVPVQLVWGEDDKFFPVAWAHEMVGTFPDARIHVVDDAGLFVHEERPGAVARALLPLLTGEHRTVG